MLADTPLTWREFSDRRAGMLYAMDGGLWLHRHVWMGRAMAHLVSTDRERLLAYGRAVGLPENRLQYKPLKDPRTGERREAWHWDLVREFLPPRTAAGTGGPHRPTFDLAVDGARAAATAGRLGDWVASYLSLGDWANPALRDELLEPGAVFGGPVLVPMTRLRAAHGADDAKISRLVRSIRHPRYLPPLIAVPDGETLLVVDGVQRLEALRRLGHDDAWTIVASTNFRL